MLDDIKQVLRHDEGAIEFFMLMHRILHFWDDLVDRDKDLTDSEINAAMWTALIDLPSSQFYQQNFYALKPVLTTAIANWMASTEFERNPTEKRLQIAFIARSDYINILLQCAYLVGGRDWLLHVTPIVRERWTSEDFAAYEKNLTEEAVARTAAMVATQ
jgi:hypothetical protein